MRKGLRATILFVITSYTAQSTTIEKIPLTQVIVDANKIFICQLIKLKNDSSQFLIIRNIKGEASVKQSFSLFTRNMSIETGEYYAIGEFGTDTLDIISIFKKENNLIEMYQSTVNRIISIYSNKNIKSKRKKYIQLLFWLIDRDFLKKDALYELSRGNRILYEYAEINNLRNEYDEPDEYKALTDSERRKIFNTFIELKYPSWYEWRITNYFIGFYDERLKQHIYSLMNEIIIELEKNKYFNSQTGSMFAVLKKIETNKLKLKIIEDFRDDVSVYSDHREIDYLKKIKSIN
jgi:hypothetical protein